jgi:RecA/RadA recombinase
MSTDAIASKMGIVTKLKGQSVVLIDKKTALWKISSEYELIIDVTFPPELWAVKHNGKECDWKKSFEVSNIIKAQIEVFAGDYLAACEALAFGEDTTEIDDTEIKNSEEEENKIIEMERREKAADAAKAAQEKENAMRREENEKRLEMAAQAKQQEDDELENLKKENSPASDETNGVYDEPDEKEEEIPPIRTGEVKLCDILYDLIEDDLLQIFGHTGTGKTSIAMKAATEARELKKSVIYIDTEHNITKKQADSIKKLGIVYEYIPKFDNLYSFIKRLPKYDVVVVDSLGLPVLSLFAEANMKEKGNALMKMIAISSFLKNYANENHSLVIVLNQPESDMNKDPLTERKPFGDKSSYCYKEIISSKFAKGGRTEKKTTIVVKAFRSRSCGMGTKLFTVEITGDGIKVIQ